MKHVYEHVSLYTLSQFYSSHPSNSIFKHWRIDHRSARLHLSPPKVAGTTGLCIIAPIQAWTLDSSGRNSMASVATNLKPTAGFSIHSIHGDFLCQGFCFLGFGSQKCTKYMG